MESGIKEKKRKTECMELRRLIIIPRAGFPAPSLAPSSSSLSGIETRMGIRVGDPVEVRTWDSAPSSPGGNPGKWLSHPGLQSSCLYKVPDDRGGTDTWSADYGPEAGHVALWSMSSLG